MKVLDLQCQLGHVFEGWFASEDDFQSQKQRGLVQCPLCADDHIEKRLSAPRLNLGARAPSSASVEPGPSASSDGGTLQVGTSPALSPVLQAAWLELARKIVANTEDVGAHFAQEARRMHHGEVQERAIRGQATPGEAMELLEEGIAVMPLPLPAAAKETLQ
ncbi:hypothetical protein ASE52_14130 [Acidovorax sp. Root275]|jgi:hypothetical protein|uniref:DUF1178 family protein n=1 Tax=Acidovorax sp. Root275 TaxID=1736508 RepID=UPI00070C0E03|nr:DUF1178 family protein [Acidovorax sp. Root275]KRD48479.1 hypothetical protein ASE52_14130 [Acidovorax sp. Root275]